jgi:hypothetical protein
MTRYRYRIEVGDQYTYRGDSFALDHLIHELLDEGINYESAVGRLLRKARGDENVPEPPKCEPIPAEAIRITVERLPPPPPAEEEKWHRIEADGS